MKTNNLTNSFKPLTLAIALTLGTSAVSEAAEHTMDNTNMNASPVVESNDTSWMSPHAAEFSKLDTTGNGLLLPNEASKGKAFSKQTFAKADANRDGYIDQNEYVYFKTGEWPESMNQKANVDEQATVEETPSEMPAQMPSDDSM
ncbi:MAG: hypothetical protein V4570_00625 [Pseudomonadota bacterium]